MTPFDVAAARRLARLALNVENANTGYDQGFITHKPRTVSQEARHLVDGWFADRYGWPLSSREHADRNVFLAAVLAQIKEMRP